MPIPIARLTVAAVLSMSTPAWSQSLLFNSDSPRGRQVGSSGTGVGLGAPIAPISGTGQPTALPQIGTTIGTTVGTTIGSTIGTARGTSLGSTMGQ